MSKITLTKKLRKGYLHLIDKRDPLMKDSKIVDFPPQAMPREKAGDCYICHLPVHASSGQFLKWASGPKGEHLYSHKICRKNK